jgi:protein tyrosine/serine phosphatase
MTQIIPYLYQIGAHELYELHDADWVIDMGGILSRTYVNYFTNGNIDTMKEWQTFPVISFEIDEVPDAPFHRHEFKLAGVIDIAQMGAELIKKQKNVYTLCLAGQNRSGLMSAMIMMLLGYATEDAVRIIQERRKNALSNDVLRKYILTL